MRLGPAIDFKQSLIIKACLDSIRTTAPSKVVHSPLLFLGLIQVSAVGQPKIL
jgi:hypothetical protein